MKGQLVIQKTVPLSSEGTAAETFDLSSYNKGVYVLKIQTGEVVQTSKIVIR